MALANSAKITLAYGENRCFSCEIEAKRIAVLRPGAAAEADFAEQLRQALGEPLDFPPLAQAVYPDDKIVLAIAPETPEVPAIVAAVWQIIAQREITASCVCIVQPLQQNGDPPSDPRSALPADVRDQIAWRVHDPATSHCAYLGATSSGERIYLAQELVDADVVISLGTITYDSLIGYRGTNSAFYPHLSNSEACRKANGQGHNELGPDDARPLRQMIDEIGWMLGTQFAIQVIPSGGGGAAGLLAGLAESVFRRGKQVLAEHWLVEVDERPEIVVAAVDHDAGGHGWNQLGAALAAARSLVAQDGKIVLLTELSSEFGEGLQALADSDTPGDAFRPLRTQSPRDLIAATQCAQAVDWANVYLLSQLDGDSVEDIFMIPIDEEGEVARLLEGDRTCAFLGSAQHAFGRVRDA